MYTGPVKGPRIRYPFSSCNLSFSTNYSLDPPGGTSKQKKLLHTLRENVVLWLAPGVGFEPTRPEGAQADSRAYSRHGPACKADCPVPGSGIPAKHATVLTTIFPFGTRRIDPETRRGRIASEHEKPRNVPRRITRVAMGASQPTTLNGRMAV